MADTYRAVFPAITFGNLKSMAGLFNGGASTKVLRILRIWALNNQTAAVTGVLVNLELRKITALSGGTAISPRKMDSNNADLDAAVYAAHGGTATDSDLLKKYLWSNDEPAASAATTDEWETIIALNVLWDAGFRDTSMQKYTLRAGEGIHLKCVTNTTVGNMDIVIEFTQEAS